MKAFNFILIIHIFFSSILCMAQNPVTVSIFNEATAIPFTSFNLSPVHPGIQIGTELDGKKKNHFRMYPVFNIGYMFHRKLFQGIYADVKLGFDYKTAVGIYLKSHVGLGGLYTFTTQQEYQFDNGKYVSKPDKGNVRLMPSLTFGIGYDLRKADARSPEMFILYTSWLEFPYSPDFIPLMAHTSIHIGTKFYPFKVN